MRSYAEKTARSALFLALAMILSYVEAIVPLGAVIPIPGFKLGLASLAVTGAFFLLGLPYAIAVSVGKTLLSSLLFGSVTSFWFSFSGGLLVLLTLGIYRLVRPKTLGCIGLSVICAAMHNAGQCLAASVLFGFSVLVYYLPALLFAALATGTVTGILLYLILKYTKHIKAFS